MEQEYRVLGNEPIAKDVFRMELRGDTGWIKAPGQFVNVLIDGYYLRRPLSVCDWTADSLTLIYKILGQGTEALAGQRPSVLRLLTGLGNGFSTEIGQAARPLVVGGGVGVPPLYGLCKALLREGKKPAVVLGFNRREDVFYLDEFKSLGLPVALATMDGSAGTKGTVLDAIEAEQLDFDYYYACGPKPMLKALAKNLAPAGQLSLEERMACGFGACMGCSIMTKVGPKRVCKDGPVFQSGELLWND